MWIKAAVNYLRYYTSIHLEIIRKPTGNLAICRPRSPNRALTHTKQRYQLLNQVIHFLKGIIGRPHYCKPLVVAQVYQEEKKKKSRENKFLGNIQRRHWFSKHIFTASRSAVIGTT